MFMFLFVLGFLLNFALSASYQPYHEQDEPVDEDMDEGPPAEDVQSHPITMASQYYSRNRFHQSPPGRPGPSSAGQSIQTSIHDQGVNDMMNQVQSMSVSSPEDWMSHIDPDSLVRHPISFCRNAICPVTRMSLQPGQIVFINKAELAASMTRYSAIPTGCISAQGFETLFRQGSFQNPLPYPEGGIGATIQSADDYRPCLLEGSTVITRQRQAGVGDVTGVISDHDFRVSSPSSKNLQMPVFKVILLFLFSVSMAFCWKVFKKSGNPSSDLNLQEFSMDTLLLVEDYNTLPEEL